MRLLFRLIEILLLVGAAAVAAVIVTFWLNQGAVIDRSAHSGVLRQAFDQAPLSLAEQTIAADQFSQNWGSEAFPCRTLAQVWSDVAGAGGAAQGTPISQRLAASLLPDRRVTSVRWQVSRIVIACQLEQRFDDGQMLRAWLSTASFGQNTIGLENAAQAIFQKHAAQLNADDSAKIAALVRSPSLRDNPDRWAQSAKALAERLAARHYSISQ